MPNMAAIISKHNKITLQNRANPRHTTLSCSCWNKVNCPFFGRKMLQKLHYCIYRATLKSNGIARQYCTMVAVKRNSKLVSTTTNKALYIDTKEMPWNCRRPSGMPKMQEHTLASNGVSRQKLIHINWEQNRATSVLPRNLLFCNPTLPQHSTKDHSLTANAATKTSSN